MTDEHLMKLMKRVDPLTVRIPPGVRAIANAIEAEERERCARWLATKHNEVPATGAKFAAALRMYYEQT